MPDEKNPKAAAPATAATPAKKAASTGRTLDLGEPIMFRGRTYGPGKGVTVPSDFPDPKILAEKRKISSARNTQTPMPVSTGGKPEAQPAAATPEGGEGEGDDGDKE